jgi:hypothetical protein
MTTPAKYMTWCDRRRRKLAMAYAMAYGETVVEIAARFGVSLSTVYASGREKGVATSGKRGRPRIWKDCPSHLIDEYDFLVRKKRIPAGNIKGVLERSGMVEC